MLDTVHVFVFSGMIADNSPRPILCVTLRAGSFGGVDSDEERNMIYKILLGVVLTASLCKAADSDVPNMRENVKKIEGCLIPHTSLYTPEPPELILWDTPDICAAMNQFYCKLTKSAGEMPCLDPRASDLLEDKMLKEFEGAFLKSIVCQYASPQDRKSAFTCLYSKKSIHQGCALQWPGAISFVRVYTTTAAMAHLSGVDGCQGIILPKLQTSGMLKKPTVSLPMIDEVVTHVLQTFKKAQDGRTLLAQISRL